MEYKEDCKSCIYLNTNGTCGNSRSIMFGVVNNAGNHTITDVTTRKNFLRNRKENVKYKAYIITNK